MIFTLQNLILILTIATTQAQADWLKNVTQKYDRRLRPNAGGPAVKVSVQIGIVSMGPINAKEFTFDVDMYLRHWWNDPRLTFGGNFTYNYNGDPADIIWVPDTYFENAKKAVSHKVLTENKRAKITPGGDVFVSMRVTASSSCPMDLRLYPFDAQECQLILGSYSFTGNELDMSWNSKPVTIDTVSGNVQVSSYAFKGVKTEKVKAGMGSQAEHFIILKCKFLVERSFTSSISRIYIPSSFLVILTWATFYLPASSVPARITLIVTNFLATVFITQSTSSQIAEVEYTTAIGIYLLANITFITAALLELLVVLNVPDRKKTKNPPKMKKSTTESKNDMHEKIEMVMEEREASKSTPEQKKEDKGTHFVDQYAKIFFPVCYTLFIIAYFSYFLTMVNA